MTGLRVLVADDDPDIRNLIEIAVRRAGMIVVDSVDNGSAALDRVAAGGIDLAVLDVSMPEMSGLDVLRALRSATAAQGPRVVLVSASVGSAALEAGTQAGADDYVMKPFSPRELSARLVELQARWQEEAP